MLSVPQALAMALQNYEAGQLQQAEQILQQMLQADPNQVDALQLRGVIALQTGRANLAVGFLREALRLKPDSAEAHMNLAVALHLQGYLDEAVASYQRSLGLRPDFVEAHINLGSALQAQGKLTEAVVCYEQALRLKPDYAEAHTNLGHALRELGQTKQAVACLEHAVRLRSNSAEAHMNLAIALHDQAEWARAAGHLEEALRLRPDFAEAHYNRSMLRLLEGNFEQGWPEYEWRWRIHERAASPRRPEPPWDGRPLDGKTVLLYAEQGLGDTLQFIRYAAVVKDRGGRVVVQCQPALRGVLAGCPGIDQLVPQGEPLPPCDVQAALLSLPALCGATLATIPANVPYLVPDRSCVADWQKRLAGVAGFKVGICWQGDPAYRHDRWRSVPLARFAALADVPNVRLVCLQKGAGRQQWDSVTEQWPTVELPERAEEPSRGWLETAALLCAVDLVITVDTAVAHLAGALGVPVWVALPFRGDWRWLLRREDSPWYPSMRLVRQTQPEDWTDVFQRIKAALQARLRC